MKAIIKHSGKEVTIVRKINATKYMVTFSDNGKEYIINAENLRLL